MNWCRLLHRQVSGQQARMCRGLMATVPVAATARLRNDRFLVGPAAAVGRLPVLAFGDQLAAVWPIPDIADWTEANRSRLGAGKAHRSWNALVGRNRRPRCLCRSARDLSSNPAGNALQIAPRVAVMADPGD